VSVDVVIGLQRGDEGKGKTVDLLGDYDVVARFNGGPNAGHTLVIDGAPLVLHQVPSGVAHPDTLNVIGNGVLLDPVRLVAEMADIRKAGLVVDVGNLAVSSAVHLILPHHRALDVLREAGDHAQGSTLRGIAFAAGEKYIRNGIRANALHTLGALAQHATTELYAANQQLQTVGLAEFDVETEISALLIAARAISPYLTNTSALMNSKLHAGSRILAEGAQAADLDIDHGDYPYVTSSSTGVGGVLSGLGVGPQHIDRIIGVAKATQSHVGGGPFPTEITDSTIASRLRGERDEVDGEYGKSTGRARRVGRLDLVRMRRAVTVNGVNEIALNKLDCVSRFGSTIQVATAYILDGQQLDWPPDSADELARCEPVYTELPGWEGDIRNVRLFEDLPVEAQNYVAFLEEQLGTKVSIIGVGPGPDQVIRRDI